MKNDIFELERSLEKIDSEKENYTFLDVIKQSPNNENLISNWLAFLLNPNINGVGNKILVALLNAIGRNDINLENQDFICIERESSTDNGKRMDLLIKYSKNWIVIENKIYAQETGAQTKEYYDFIHNRKEDENVIYIYLKPSQNLSKPSSQVFIELTYDRFIGELKKIKREDYNEKENYKYIFLKEFEIIGENFMSENNYYIDEKTEIYINYIDIIEKITRQYNEKNKLLIDEICKRLKECLENDGGFVIDCKMNWGVIQISKEKWKNNNFKGIHYEIWCKNLSNLLGNKNAEIHVCLHAESDISNEIIHELKKYNIEKISGDSINYTIKNLSFNQNDKIEKSINEIISSINELNKKYTKDIDEVMNRF